MRSTLNICCCFLFYYGNLIASVIRDDLNVVNFNNLNAIGSYYDDCLKKYGNSWLTHDLNIIQSKLSHLSKDDTLCALQSIPSNLRPMYNT